MHIFAQSEPAPEGGNRNPALTANRDITPADYRIKIGEMCGFDFKSTVIESNSNTDSAIYFRKDHLKEIGDKMEIKINHAPITTHDLRTAIRSNAGCDSPSQPKRYFREEQLKSIIQALSHDPEAVTPYLTTELRQIAGGAIAGKYYKTLLEKSPVNVFLSANLGSGNVQSRIYYPYIMHPVHEIPDSASKPPNCHSFIVDSSYDREDIDNIDAVNTAIQTNADGVVLADVYHEPVETIRRLEEGVRVADKFNGNIILPLQPPIDKSVELLKESTINHRNHIIAIGGLRKRSVEEKIKAAKKAREILSDQVHIHGLGFGVTDKLAQTLSSTPSLLDSIDYSTPVQSSISSTSQGKQRMLSVAAEANSKLIHDLRKLSTYADNETEDNDKSGQQTTVNRYRN